MPEESSSATVRPHRPLRASHEAFETNELSVRAQNARLTFTLAILIILLGIATDSWLYPENLTFYAVVRISCCLLLCLILYSLRSPTTRTITPLCHLGVLISTGFTLWIIDHSGDPLCPYHEGLSLIIIVNALILRWRFIDSLINTIFILIAYTLIFFHLEGPIDHYLTKTYFLFAAVLFSNLSSYLYNNHRHREFYLREEVEANRLDLIVKNEELRDAFTRLQEQEEELIRSEKLSSLGQMSAGIVHEINNPLNYANTSVYLLKTYRQHLPEDQMEDYDDILADLADALQRVIHIITDLRALTRGDEIAKLPTPVHQIVTNATRLLGSELGPVSLILDIPRNLQILGNENQLCQVFVNLLQNAVHATIKLADHKPIIRLSARNPQDGFIVITVQDNGSGIPMEIQNKIFDPFFTTKDTGLGTGLGLSLTQKIIHDHQGTLTLDSAPGEGATFTIHLPSTASPMNFPPGPTQ